MPEILYTYRYNTPYEKEKNEMNNEVETNMEIMMVQLLFNSKPKSPTADKVKKALEKYLGDLGEIPYAEPSKISSGDMFMFPLEKYKVVTKDHPDGIPAMAVFLSSEPESGIEVDEMARSQFWDVQNGEAIINDCKYTVLVHTMLGMGLTYQEQAEILLAQVGAALDCYPGCTGIYVAQSGKLITPDKFESFKKFSVSERFIDLFVNARFFNISDTDEMVVDTLGFYVFGGADVQMHFKKLDPTNVVNYVYNIASYQFDNGFPIQSGETIDSIDENGNIQMKPQWPVQYENSLIDPPRSVLDINCGKYAGGKR